MKKARVFAVLCFFVWFVDVLSMFSVIIYIIYIHTQLVIIFSYFVYVSNKDMKVVDIICFWFI